MKSLRLFSLTNFFYHPLVHHFTLFLLWCLKLLVSELSAVSWEGKELALELGVPQCSLGGCLLHSMLGHTSAAGLCHLILTQHQETPLPVSCGGWRQRQVGLCQCSCFPHGQVRARCWCSLEVSEQRCKVSAQLLGVLQGEEHALSPLLPVILLLGTAMEFRQGWDPHRELPLIFSCVIGDWFMTHPAPLHEQETLFYCFPL